MGFFQIYRILTDFRGYETDGGHVPLSSVCWRYRRYISFNDWFIDTDIADMPIGIQQCLARVKSGQSSYGGIFYDNDILSSVTVG